MLSTSLSTRAPVGQQSPQTWARLLQHGQSEPCAGLADDLGAHLPTHTTRHAPCWHGILVQSLACCMSAQWQLNGSMR